MQAATGSLLIWCLTLPMADKTIQGNRCGKLHMIWATSHMRSALATEEPPNFMTTLICKQRPLQHKHWEGCSMCLFIQRITYTCCCSRPGCCSCEVSAKTSGAICRASATACVQGKRRSKYAWRSVQPPCASACRGLWWSICGAERRERLLWTVGDR